MNPPSGPVGTVIRGLRKQQSKGLRTVAATAGIAFSYLSEIETGKKQASLDTLELVSTALGVTFPDLLREIATACEVEARGGHS